MTKLRIRIIGVAVLTACALGVSWPTDSFASLASMACQWIKNGCDQDCDSSSNRISCYRGCSADYKQCMARHAGVMQQTPPPPCRGIHGVFAASSSADNRQRAAA